MGGIMFRRNRKPQQPMRPRHIVFTCWEIRDSAAIYIWINLTMDRYYGPELDPKGAMVSAQ
jgi:hypothetical protein